ncbi:MAG: hypothetical protein JWP62_1526 [Blastococcus sp.]|nr:hypothetical protein [Blastococcus sp.]
MTDRPHDEPPAPDDRTRDITLPPLPDRPPSALPREWAGMQPRPSSRTPEVPAPSSEGAGPAPDFSAPPPDTHVVDVAAPTAAPHGTPLVDEPTDQLDPPRGRPRERTLAFAYPEMAGGRPAPTVRPTPRRPRRWPWVVLTLLPILVIVGAGITFLLLLRGG